MSMKSLTPQPGVKSLGNHLNDAHDNFLELYQMLDSTVSGFIGVGQDPIRTAVQAIVKPMINAGIAKLNNVIVEVTNPSIIPHVITSGVAVQYTITGLVYTLGSAPTVELTLNSEATVFATVAATSNELEYSFSYEFTLPTGVNTINLEVTNSVGTIVTSDFNITVSN